MWELPPEIAAKVAEIRPRPDPNPHRAAGPALMGPEVSTYEARVLDLLVEGHTNAEIAELACLAEESVKSHLRHVKIRTGSKNRTHIAVRYVRGEFAVVGLRR